LREVAGYYLEERPTGCHEYRFDVVGIILKEGEEACFELVCGAFYRGELK